MITLFSTLALVAIAPGDSPNVNSRLVGQNPGKISKQSVIVDAKAGIRPD